VLRHLFAQSYEGRGTPAGRDLVDEQTAERPEQELVKAEIGNLELFGQLGALDRVGCSLDKDFQVLFDAWVGLGRKSTGVGRRMILQRSSPSQSDEPCFLET
jgi:hypothetical protein